MEPRKRNGARTRSEIREAATNLFYEHGYEATSLRAVASEVGIKVGSLYNHMGSKDELLVEIMTEVLDQLTAQVEEAVANAGPDPVNQLAAALSVHLCFHAKHSRDTFVGNSELRALGPDQRHLVYKKRSDYEELMRDLVVAAAAAQRVPLLDARLQTYAVLALGMHVASWYREASGPPLQHVVDVFTQLSLRQIGVTVTAPVGGATD